MERSQDIVHRVIDSTLVVHVIAIPNVLGADLLRKVFPAPYAVLGRPIAGASSLEWLHKHEEQSARLPPSQRKRKPRLLPVPEPSLDWYLRVVIMTQQPRASDRRLYLGLEPCQRAGI